MTQFQNRRQHWIFPFSVGMTNVQHVAYLSLRFILKKLINSVLRFVVAPVAQKIQHTHLSGQKKYRYKPCFIASFAFVLRPPVSGGREGRCGQSPHPFKKLVGGIFL